MTPTLRGYQSEAIQATYDWLAGNDGNALIVLPTGTGKSLVLAGICRDALDGWPDTRILILSQVRELLVQDYATLLRLWPEAPAGLYSAGLNRREISAQVLVAGIQSIYRNAYRVQRCDILLIDEAHLIGRTEGGMYRQFIRDLRSINPHMRVIGLTATPYRTDSGLLHEGDDRIFDGIAYEASMLRMIEQGYLCEVRAKSTATKLDVSGVGTRGGEFIAADLEAAVDVEEITRAAVAEIVTAGQARGSWLVFCAGVKHAEHVRDAIREHGILCETVAGDTPTAQRDRILSDFKAGRLRALTNMGVLTTGFDAPGVDLIAFLRPTKSLALYVQMTGRGTRLAEGKTECLILDFAGNVARHGPVDMASGRKKAKGDPGAPPVKVCPECQTIVAIACQVCPGCGHEFPAPKPKIDRAASDAPVLSIHARPDWVPVSGVSYGLHAKEGKPDSMVVRYQCGLRQYREWVCFGHTGYPRQRAVDWWQRRTPGQPVPNDAAEALNAANSLPKPDAITVKPAGQYTEITSVRFA